jgi:hypothetical protein
MNQLSPSDLDKSAGAADFCSAADVEGEEKE